MARPSDGTQPKGGKKNRKHGRNRKWCEAYRARGQREINKAKKAKRRSHRDQSRKNLGRDPEDRREQFA